MRSRHGRPRRQDGFDNTLTNYEMARGTVDGEQEAQKDKRKAEFTDAPVDHRNLKMVEGLSDVGELGKGDAFRGLGVASRDKTRPGRLFGWLPAHFVPA